MNAEMKLVLESKKSIVVSAKNIDTLLGLDINGRYHEEDQNEELVLYKPMDSIVMQIMKITKNEDRTYNFSYCEMNEESDADI